MFCHFCYSFFFHSIEHHAFHRTSVRVESQTRHGINRSPSDGGDVCEHASRSFGVPSDVHWRPQTLCTQTDFQAIGLVMWLDPHSNIIGTRVDWATGMARAAAFSTRAARGSPTRVLARTATARESTKFRRIPTTQLQGTDYSRPCHSVHASKRFDCHCQMPKLGNSSDCVYFFLSRRAAHFGFMCHGCCTASCSTSTSVRWHWI